MSIRCLRGHDWKRKTITDTDIVKKCTKCGEVVYKSYYNCVSGEKARIDGYYRYAGHVNPAEDDGCYIPEKNDRQYSGHWFGQCNKGHKIKYELVSVYSIYDLR